jgi:hypothetical protein
VSINGSTGTGSVTLVTTAGTSNITIVGSKNIQRTSDFTTGGDLFADTLNDELDNQTIFIQQVAETAERGLKAPVTDPTDIAMTLPAKDGRKGKVLAFDSTTGNPVAGPALDSVVTVIEQSDNINTVADNIASVNTVAGNTSNINTVAGVSSSVTTVAGSISNVNTVASDLNEPTSEINTVAVNIDNVNEVGNYILNVNAVAANTSNINSVAGNSTNINAVAGNSTNINTVATNSTNINTVATNIANVNTVATNIANVNQVAADTVVINSASANATAAADSALAASGSATSASASAAAASAVALGNEPVRHSVRPSLLLDFANTKTLDPRITFTRASTGTFYDGKTVAKAEENLLIRSQEFDSISWTKSLCTVTANTDVAPDGTTTAETYLATGNNAELYQGYSAIAQPYTFSVWLKRKTGTGTVSILGDGGTYVAQTITSSWARYSVTQTPTAGSKVVSIRLGTSGDEVYVWGAQLEARSSLTAYTATTTAPITNYIPVLQTAASGVARFEHNPVTGESLGLEIEEQRTNLTNYSEQFDNAYWTKAKTTVVANTAIAPDGTLTAELVHPNASDTAAYAVSVGRLTGSLSNTVRTVSFFVKSAGWRWIYVLSAAASGEVWFDLQNGVVGTQSGTATGQITPVGNGWYRVTVARNLAASSFYGYVGFSNADNSTVCTVNATSGVFLWGAQVEDGSFATSYIPTVASQVTRSADLVVMTGTNFSSWFRTNEGTLYAEADTIPYNASLSGGVGVFGFDNETTNNQIGVRYTTGGTVVAGYVTVNGTFPSSGTQFTANTGSNKFTIAYQGNVNVFDSAGSAVISNTGTYSSIQPMTRATIGFISGGNYLNGTVKKVAYYPLRLQNAELQGLTTI